MGKTVFTTNSARITGYSHSKESTGPATSVHMQLNSKWIKDLSVGAKITKLLE